MCDKIHRIRHFLTSDGGPTAVEYAVMLAFIVISLYAVVASIGTQTSGMFSTVSSVMTSAS